MYDILMILAAFLLPEQSCDPELLSHPDPDLLGHPNTDWRRLILLKSLILQYSVLIVQNQIMRMAK